MGSIRQDDLRIVAEVDLPLVAGVLEIPVWDPLVRLVHWLLAAAIVTNGFILDPESRLHEFIGELYPRLRAAPPAKAAGQPWGPEPDA